MAFARAAAGGGGVEPDAAVADVASDGSSIAGGDHSRVEPHRAAARGEVDVRADEVVDALRAQYQQLHKNRPRPALPAHEEDGMGPDAGGVPAAGEPAIDPSRHAVHGLDSERIVEGAI